MAPTRPIFVQQMSLRAMYGSCDAHSVVRTSRQEEILMLSSCPVDCPLLNAQPAAHQCCCLDKGCMKQAYGALTSRGPLVNFKWPGLLGASTLSTQGLGCHLESHQLHSQVWLIIADPWGTHFLRNGMPGRSFLYAAASRARY